jgi:SAM-dependent methyltransferase
MELMSTLPLETNEPKVTQPRRATRPAGGSALDQIRTRRWFEISSNPNHPTLLRDRQRYLNRIRRQRLIENRVAYLTQAVAGKDLLDVGCVDHYSESEAEKREEWLHGALAKAARSCLGVDILEDEVAKLRARGYDVVCRNLIEQPLDQKFDVIVCGEVFEHVGAPEALLRSLASMLRPEGKLIITVPNPFYMNAMMKSFFNGKQFVDNVDHIVWYDPSTFLELGQRCDLLMTAHAGILSRDSQTASARAFFSMRPLLAGLGVRSEVFAKSSLYEFTPQYYPANHNKR